MRIPHRKLTTHDTNPAVQAINANFCSMFEGMLAAGVHYDGLQALEDS